jgi:hypothetical protein
MKSPLLQWDSLEKAACVGPSGNCRSPDSADLSLPITGGQAAGDESPGAANAILSTAKDTGALVGTLHSSAPSWSGCQEPSIVRTEELSGFSPRKKPANFLFSCFCLGSWKPGMTDWDLGPPPSQH